MYYEIKLSMSINFNGSLNSCIEFVLQLHTAKYDLYDVRLYKFASAASITPNNNKYNASKNMTLYKMCV